MAAKNHLNPKQLKLFMTPDEIMSSVTDSVDRTTPYTDSVYDDETGEYVDVHYPGQTMDELWDNKLSESKGKGWGIPEPLYDSIAKHGVKRHVTLQPNYHDDGYTMGQGHHRVAAAADIAKKTGDQVFIPVIYDDDWDFSSTREYKNAYPQNINPVGFKDFY